VPSVPTAGVPERVAVPLPLSEKLTPLGRAPDSVRPDVGRPDVVTVKVPAEPAVKVVDEAEVMAGAWSMVRVKDWVALGEIPFDALMVIG
jgi:hypothetical protein